MARLHEYQGKAVLAAKAFWKLDLDLPAVIHLGGNPEDGPVEILQRMS